jgi:hypothetical protein
MHAFLILMTSANAYLVQNYKHKLSFHELWFIHSTTLISSLSFLLDFGGLLIAG